MLPGRRQTQTRRSSNLKRQTHSMRIVAASLRNRSLESPEVKKEASKFDLAWLLDNHFRGTPQKAIG